MFIGRALNAGSETLIDGGLSVNGERLNRAPSRTLCSPAWQQPGGPVCGVKAGKQEKHFLEGIFTSAFIRGNQVYFISFLQAAQSWVRVGRTCRVLKKRLSK